MIDPNTVSQIMNTARIEEVVSDFVTLRKRGVNLLGLCPFHDEKTGSFTVSPAKGIFKCFGCGKGGNAVHFLMEHEHITYVDALKMLAKKYHIEVQERELTENERVAQNARESMFLLNDYAKNYFVNVLHEDPSGRAVGLSYFRERGFRDDIIKKFQLGFSPDQWSAFSDTALKNGYAQEYLVKTGLAFEKDGGGLTDRFRGRVMFPVHTLSGKVIAFGGRVLKNADKTAKYVNSPESEIYHKSNELYGIYFAKSAIVKNDNCFLVEGYTDVIQMHQSGIENVVASSGTSLTPGQIRLIHRFTENVTIIYDGDAAGIKASLRGIDLLLEEGLNIKVLLLPDGDDPDSFARKQDASQFIEYVQKNQTDFMRFKTNLLLKEVGNDPVKRVGMIQDIVQSIAIIPNNLLRQVYAHDCSTLLDIDEKALLDAIAKIQNQKRSELILKKKRDDERNAAQNAQQANSADTPDKSLEAVANSVVPIEITTTKKYDAESRNIIQFLIKYGERTLYTNEETNENVSVGAYILEELQRDQIVFENPIYMQILEEYKQNAGTENFVSESFFKFHFNNEISQLAVDLITEKYAISKVHFAADPSLKKKSQESENLHKLVPQLIFELKNSLVRDMMKAVLDDIKLAAEQKDELKLKEAFARKDMLDVVRKSLSVTLRISPVVRI